MNIYYIFILSYWVIILVIPVPNEFNVSNMFNPDMYNKQFIFVVLFNVVNPDTFNDDNNVVISFNDI